MKEVKPSKKPLAIYYAIVLAVLLLLNLVLLPWMSERQVEEVPSMIPMMRSRLWSVPWMPSICCRKAMRSATDRKSVV